MKENTLDGGPAFPIADRPNGRGMSLRDYFAGKVLIGYLSDINRIGSFKDYADDAYAFADAMIAARNRAAK